MNLKLVKKHSAKKDPFFLKEINYNDIHEFHVYIEEGNDNSVAVYDGIPDLITARNMTNRLNNAIYRWLAREVD